MKNNIICLTKYKKMLYLINLLVTLSILLSGCTRDKTRKEVMNYDNILQNLLPMVNFVNFFIVFVYFFVGFFFTNDCGWIIEYSYVKKIIPTNPSKIWIIFVLIIWPLFFFAAIICYPIQFSIFLLRSFRNLISPRTCKN